MHVQSEPETAARDDAAETAATVPAVQERTLESLRPRLRGDLLVAGDAAYEEARLVHNRAYDRFPAAIVQAADPADVIRAVAFAREHDLRIAVKGGGHSVVGYGTGDGVLVVDLSKMRSIQIDAERRVAWAEAGLTAGEFTVKAAEYGLATPFGDAATVGIAGLTLGGGIGYLSRKYGLTIDNLLSVELVTADGRLVLASETENPDLFWAVRGGGGNFGIVVGLEFRLQPVGMVYGGGLILPLTRNALRGLLPVAAAAPEELTVIANIMAAPPLPFIPQEQWGKPAMLVLGVYAGDLEQGPAAWAPFRELATPIADLVGPMPYPAIYEYTREAGHPAPMTARTLFVDAIDDASVDAIVEAMEHSTSPLAIVQVRPLGGAVARVDPAATAFAHRTPPAAIAILQHFVGEATVEEHVAWTERLFAALLPRDAGAYVNFVGDEGENGIRRAYPAATYRRLARIKADWDPENVFSLNQNVKPAAR